MAVDARWTGRDVARLRARFHLSKAELARQISLHARTVRKWEAEPDKPLTKSASKKLSDVEEGEGVFFVDLEASLHEFFRVKTVKDSTSSIPGSEFLRGFNAWRVDEFWGAPVAYRDFARFYRTKNRRFNSRSEFSGLAWRGGAAPPELPKVPQQGLGVRFEQSSDGRVALARGSTLSSDERSRLNGLHQLLREAANDLLKRVRGSNGYRSLERSAAWYVETLDRPTDDLRDGDIEILYGAGLALQAARGALAKEIEHGEAPPEDISISVPLHQLLGLHGPFLQSTKRGLELYDQTDRDLRNHADEIALKERQQVLNRLLAGSPQIITDTARGAIGTLTDTMGVGPQEPRANVTGRSAIRNLWSALANAAIRPLRWGFEGVVSAVAGKILVDSKAGAFVVAGGAALLDGATGAGGQVALVAQAFFIEHAPLIMAMADAGGASFDWIRPFIEWLKVHAAGNASGEGGNSHRS